MWSSVAAAVASGSTDSLAERPARPRSWRLPVSLASRPQWRSPAARWTGFRSPPPGRARDSPAVPRRRGSACRQPFVVVGRAVVQPPPPAGGGEGREGRVAPTPGWRPARAGGVFDLLHAGQEAVAVDFRTEDGTGPRFGGSSKPPTSSWKGRGPGARTARDLRRGAAGRSGSSLGGAEGSGWPSITGHGRAAPGRDRVGLRGRRRGGRGPSSPGTVTGDVSWPTPWPTPAPVWLPPPPCSRPSPRVAAGCSTCHCATWPPPAGSPSGSIPAPPDLRPTRRGPGRRRAPVPASDSTRRPSSTRCGSDGASPAGRPVLVRPPATAISRVTCRGS